MAERRYPAQELARMRALYFPEERRHEFTAEPWDGVSFRHFRDPKVVCLEHYRPPDTPMRIGRVARGARLRGPPPGSKCPARIRTGVKL